MPKFIDCPSCDKKQVRVRSDANTCGNDNCRQIRYRKLKKQKALDDSEIKKEL